MHPEEPLSWGSTSHCEPPGREARSLQACMKGHAVEVCKIRYSGRSACEGATKRDAQWLWPFPAAAALPPLTYPPTDFLWAARQTGLAGHFSRSAKFICMGKQKNRLTATKRRNHFARIFDMRAHMTKPTTASRMVVTTPSCDACGSRESCFCARSRVDGWTWSFSGARRIFQLPWSSVHFFWGQAHLPCTSDPPTLHPLQIQTAATARGEASARHALYRYDRLVETRRLVAPNWRLGPRLARCTCRVDFFRNSTDDCLSWSSQLCEEEDFPDFPTYPGAKFTYPRPKSTYPGAKSTYPVPKSTYPIPEFLFHQARPSYPGPNRLTLEQNPATLYQKVFFSPSSTAYPTPPDQLQGR